MILSPRVLAAVGLLSLASTALAQHAVRDDFPNGKERGERFESFTQEQWQASNYASAEDMKQWQDRRYGMFIHFGITSKALKELSWGSISPRYAPDSPGIMANGEKRTEAWTQWPKDMKLEKFDAKEWVELARKAGFKYIVVTTKHHEGFHMWDTAFSDFKITNTPFGRDYVKELVDACHAAKMPVGFYFAQREWYHPDYQPVDPDKVTINNIHWTLKPGATSPLGPRHPQYLAYMKNAVTELCSKYGKIDIWWWDAVSWDGMFTKEMWDSENMTRMIRQLQPGIVINNRASLPGDFDTPEGHLGAFQDHRPWESCIPLADAWCYTGQPAHSFDHVLQLIAGAACGNGNLLLSWGPKWDGAFDPGQTQRLLEIGDWLKLNGAAIYGTRGGPWKPAPWGGSTRKDKTAYLHLFALPNGELSLPALPGRSVVSASMLVSGAAVTVKQEAGRILLTLPAGETLKGDLVVALHFDSSLDGLASVAPGEAASRFALDPATYGAVLFEKSADAGLIDLGKPVTATGLLFQQAPAGMKVSVSEDGSDWTEVKIAGKVGEAAEYPITSLVSGAQIPGRKIRFLRLDLVDGKAAKMNLFLYGKDTL